MDPVKQALLEDGAFRDITSAIIPNRRVTGRFLAKQDQVVCGLDLARRAFHYVGVSFAPRVRDGQKVKKGAILATVTGPARRVLAGERTALNFVQQLSGVATLTRRFADLAAPAHVFDTRKSRRKNGGSRPTWSLARPLQSETLRSPTRSVVATCVRDPNSPDSGRPVLKCSTAPIVKPLSKR